MNTPDEILKAQRSFSVLSGTKRIATGLMITAAVLLVGSVVVAMNEHTSLISAVSTPVMLIVVLALTRRASEQKLRAIQARLSA